MNRNRKVCGFLAAVLMLMSAIFVPLPVMGATLVTIKVTNTDTQSVLPGDTATYYIELKNSGTTDANVALRLEWSGGQPIGWTGSLSQTSITLSSGGGTQTVILTITPDQYAIAGTSKQVVVIANVTNENYEVQTTTTTTVLQKYDFVMSVIGTNVKDVVPGGNAATYMLRLNQSGLGNGLNYINITSQPPTGLTVAYSQNRVAVQPNSSADVVVYVSASTSLEAKQYQITVTATSDGGPVQTQNIIANVTRYWGVSVGSPSPVKYLNPDSLTTFTVNITNKGNKADTFIISNYKFLSPAPGWSCTYSTTVGPLNPSETGQAQVHIYAPKNATYPTSMQVKIFVVSDSNISINRSITLTAVVNKVNSLYVTANPFIQNADPGGVSTFNVTIKNTGNGEETIDLSITSVPSELTPSFSISSVTLASGTSQNVTLTVSVSSKASVGDKKMEIVGTIHDTNITSKFIIIIRVTQIYNVSIYPGGPYSKHILPGNSEKFGITVKNEGNGNDTIELSTQNTPSGLVAYFDRYTLSLSPGEITTVNLTVEVDKYMQKGSYEITVKAVSKGNAAISTTTKITAIVDQYYSVEITTTSAYNNTLPGSDAKYVVMVRNTGSGNDSFTLTASGDYPHWVSFSNSSVFLKPNEAINITVTVSVPNKTKEGNVTTIVTATSNGNKSVRDNVSLTTVVDTTYAVDAWSDPTTASVMPGHKGIYTIIIKNRGNGKDTFFINISKNPHNWGSLDIQSPFITLKSDEYSMVNLTVSVPIDASVEVLITEVTITSQGETRVYKKVSVKTEITAIHNVELTCSNANNSGEPTDILKYDVRIKNTGNGNDTFYLEILGEKRNWVTVNMSSIKLASGESTMVEVAVTIPDNENPGNYTITLKATSAGNTSKFATVRLNFEVKIKHDLDMKTEDYILVKKGDPGQTIVFEINITNLGPEKDTIYFNYTSPRSHWISISQDFMELESKKSGIVKMTVKIPKNAVPEDVPIYFKGTLKSKPNRVKYLNLTVRVGQIYDLMISSLSSVNETDPGGFVTYTLTIKNLGTGKDTFEIRSLNYTTWVSFSEDAVLLNPGESKNVSVKVTVPLRPLPSMGDYNITIEVSSIGNSSVNRTWTFIMTIRQKYEVDISANVSVMYVDPGKMAKYTLTIKNNGNGKDSFTLTKGGQHTDWVRFSISSVTLKSMETKEVYLYIQIPIDAYPQNVTTIITAKSQGNLSVSDTAMVTTVINLMYGVNISISNNYVELDTPKSATFNLTIKNTGNSNDTIELETIGSHEDWVKFNKSSVLLGPGNSTRVMITVQVPWEKPYDKFNGLYVHTIKATSSGYSFATKNVTIRTRVNINYGLEVSWDKIGSETGPGGELTYNVTIKNTGNINDIFQLAALTYTTWVSFSKNNVSILASYTATVMVTVQVPQGQPNGNYRINIEIKSSGNTSKKISTDIWANVSERFGVLLECEDSTKDGGALEIVEFHITVKNTGNVRENIDLKLLGTDTYSGWQFRIDKYTLTIDGEKEDYVKVCAIIPNEPEPGTYTIQLKATVKGHSSETSTISLTVNVYYGVELASRYTLKKGKAGEYINFTFTIKNEGSGNDTFDLEVTGEQKDWGTINETLVTLTKQSSKVLKLTVHIADDALMKKYTIQVKATSWGDSKKTATLSFTVEVKQTAGIILEMKDVSKEVLPGKSIDFTLTIKNKGNGEDTFEIEVLSSESSRWYILSRDSATIPADGSEDITISVSVPYNTKAGSYNTTIRVKSSFDESVYSTIVVEVIVEKVYDFKLSCDENTKEGEPGEILTYEIKVENKGNILDSYQLEVKNLPDDWSYNVSASFSVDSGKKKTAEIHIVISSDYEKAVYGEYTFSVEVISVNNDSVVRTISLTAIVSQVYKLVITADMLSETIVPGGDDKSFTLKVKNAGNGDDTVTMNVEGYKKGWSKSAFSFSPSSFILPPGTERKVKLTILASSIDTDTSSTTFKVYALSKDGTESDSIQFTLTVAYGVVSISEKDISYAPAKPKVGQVVTFTVKVRNTGTAQISDIRITIKVSGASLTYSSISNLKPGETKETTIRWEPDKGGEYDISIEVRYDTHTDTVHLSKPIIVQEEAAPAGILAGIMSGTNPILLAGIIVIAIIVVGIIIASSRRRPPAPPPKVRRRPRKKKVKPMMKKKRKKKTVKKERKDVVGEKKRVLARVTCPKCNHKMEFTPEELEGPIICPSCRTKMKIKKGE